MYLGDYIAFVANPKVFALAKDMMFYSPYNKETMMFGDTPANKMISSAANILLNGMLNNEAEYYNTDPYQVDEDAELRRM